MIDKLEKWANVPATEVIDKTIESLKANGIEGYVARTREDALAKIHELILMAFCS
jgi:L-lactate utilization protein LutB